MGLGGKGGSMAALVAVKLEKLVRVDFHYSLYFCRIDYS